MTFGSFGSRLVQSPLFGLIPALCVMLPLREAAAADSLRESVIERIKDNMVYLEIDFARGEGSGSGFFIEGGIIVTNSMVLGRGERGNRPLRTLTAVLNSGRRSGERRIECQVIFADDANRLVFLRTAEPVENLPEGLELLSGKRVDVEDQVWICSFPFGDALQRGRNPSVTFGTGVVQSLRRHDNLDGLLTALRIRGDFNPGSAGGPIIDSRGRVIAIADAAARRGTEVNFGIASGFIERQLYGQVTFTEYRKVDIIDGKLNLRVNSRIFDPKDRIRAVQYQFWTGPSTSKIERDVEEIGDFEVSAHGSEGDSDLEIVMGEFDEQQRNCVFVPGPLPLDDGHSLYYKIMVKRTGGFTHVNTLEVQYSHLHRIRRSLQPEIAKQGSSDWDPVANPAPLDIDHKEIEPATEEVWRVEEFEEIRYPSVDHLPLNAVEKVDVEDGGAGHIEVVMPEIRDFPVSGIKCAAAGPYGQRVFLSCDESKQVVVLDAENDYARLEDLDCPGPPGEVWADREWLVVCCPQAQKLAVYALPSLSEVGTYSLEAEGEPYRPTNVVHRDHKGRLVVIWQKVDGHDSDNFVSWIGIDGKVVAQYGGRGLGRLLQTPSGAFLSQGGDITWRLNVTALGRSYSGHTPKNLLRKVLEFDSDILPRQVSLHRLWEMTFNRNRTGWLAPVNMKRPLTLETDLNFILVKRVLPGMLMATFPNRRTGVFWDILPRDIAGCSAGENVFRYVHMDTGKTQRIIRISEREKEGSVPKRLLRSLSWGSGYCFVPSREEIIFYNTANDQAVIVKCGPVADVSPEGEFGDRNRSDASNPAGRQSPKDPKEEEPTTEQGREEEDRESPKQTEAPKARQDSDGAPVRARIGANLSFTPTRMVAEGMRFSLVDPVEGMRIDRYKGRWSWTPSAEQVGTHTVIIEGEMRSGGTIRVKEWTLEITE